MDAWHKRITQASEKGIFRASELYHTPYDVIYLQEDSAMEDLTEYPVIFYPHPLLVSKERAELLKGYVSQAMPLS